MRCLRRSVGRYRGIEVTAVRDVLFNLPFDEARYASRRKDALVAAQRIKPDALRLEAELMLEAHPMYRFLMPQEKTQLFAEEFVRQYSKWYGTAVSYKDNEKMTGLMRQTTRLISSTASRITKEMREYSSLWTRRQGADLLGMTYDKFIDSCFESHLNVKRKKFPRPNQLLSGAGAEIVLNYIEDKWRDWNNNRPSTSYMAQYRSRILHRIARAGRAPARRH